MHIRGFKAISVLISYIESVPMYMYIHTYLCDLCAALQPLFGGDTPKTGLDHSWPPRAILRRDIGTDQSPPSPFSPIWGLRLEMKRLERAEDCARFSFQLPGFDCALARPGWQSSRCAAPRYICVLDMCPRTRPVMKQIGKWSLCRNLCSVCLSVVRVAGKQIEC